MRSAPAFAPPLLAAGLLIAVPGVAQTSLEEVQAGTERLTAETARINAETARVQALQTQLGLQTDATGKTEIDDKVGAVEGKMLSARALAAAADAIAKAAGAPDAPPVPSPSPIVLLGASGTVDLDFPMMLIGEASALQAGLRHATGGQCPTVQKATTPPPAAAAGASESAVTAILGAAIGALKTDTKIQGFEGLTDDRLLVNAIAARRVKGGPAWIVPSELRQPAMGAARNALTAVSGTQQFALDCRAKMPADDAVGKAVDRASARVDAFMERVTDTKNGPSVLAQAERMGSIAARKPRVLRVAIETSGGSLLLRKNLWTALGAPAVGLTGGAVVSWRLTDPATGDVLRAGVLVCRTKLTNLRAIQRNDPIAGDLCASVASS